MLRLIVAAAAVAASPAVAECYGGGSFRTCYDIQSGNTYSTTTTGSTSQTYGTNSRTGSTWSQDSISTGGYTTTTGRDSDGNTWNVDTYSSGGMTFQSGHDSDGNYFSRTCTDSGCF